MNRLEQYNMQVMITQYDKTIPVKASKQVIASYQSCQVEIAESVWEVKLLPLTEDNRNLKGKLRFKLIKGELQNANVALVCPLENWGEDCYVLMPGAVYAGNRFNAYKLDYPPFVDQAHGQSVNMPITITDVPRLSKQAGESKIELLSGDMATPGIGVYNPRIKESLWLLGEHNTSVGYTGWSIEENEQRTRAILKISAPGVRERTCYTFANNDTPSKDRGYDFKEGDQVEIDFMLSTNQCESVQGLYDQFFDIRKSYGETQGLIQEVGFSKMMEVLYKKYEMENWNEEIGYYSVGTDGSRYQDWQSGWVGGGMNSYPLYLFGNEVTKDRVKRSLDFIFSKVQAESGYFYGVMQKGERYGDWFEHPEQTQVLLARKNADMLYFLIKQYNLIKKDEGIVSELYEKGIRKCCEAFLRLWQRYGQIGQFIDIHREEILTGGTASASALPAALILAYKTFGEEKYKVGAEEIGEYYYQHFVTCGILNGGPGEIAQGCDSESTFALLESYVVLFEVTGDTKWRDYGECVAKQAATWVVSYNFNFPVHSEFGKLGIKTLGSVIANVQNKHSAPGICTFSGDSLLKLYRMTGNQAYLELARDVAHQITQYISREDRPIKANNGINLPPGYCNERVNMCDWEGSNNVGEVFCGSCWCECSAMLTWSDFPGIYIVKDKGIICAFDNIEIRNTKFSEGTITIELVNRTKSECEVSYYVEESLANYIPWGELPVTYTGLIHLPSESKKVVTLVI